MTGYGRGTGVVVGRLVRAMGVAALLAGTAPAALAQGNAAADGGLGRRITLAIPAGPLADALAALGRQARLHIAYAPDIVAGVSSGGVTATTTVEDGLRALLAGTGIVWVPGDGGSVTLQRAPGGALLLDPLTVEGAHTAAGGWGPVPGLVATRSGTGTKTDTPLIEVPQAVSVVGREEMDRRGADDLNDAVAYTPGIRVVDYPGGSGAPDIYLRGFRDTGLFSVYQDGLRIGFNSYDVTLETYGLERIDVLKGPASVLFGQGMPGGVVNLTSKMPTETPFGEVQLQAGSHDRRQGAADVGGPLDSEGRVLYRLTGLWRDSGTQIDHAPDDRVFVAPALTVRPTDTTRITLLASHLDLTVSGAEQSIPMTGSLFPNPKGQIGTNLYFGEPGLSDWNVRASSIGYRIDQELSESWSLRQNARYSHSDVDFVSAFSTQWPVELVDGQYYPIMVQDRPKTTDTVLVDTAVQGTLTTGPLGHTLLAGIDYGWYKGRETRRNSLNTEVIDIFNPVYGTTSFTYADPWSDSESTVRQLGLYAQDQIRAGGWVLTLGGRHDRVRQTERNNLSGTSQSQTDSAWTGRIGLGHVFDSGLAPYASYATSFQPSSGTYAPERGGGMFEPTTGTQYEIGVKYQPPGRNSMITLALFHLTQQNVTTNDPVYSGFQVQEGEIRSRGIELEGKVELTEALSLIASYTYIDAEITKDNPAAGSATSNVGLTPASVPRHAAALWADYAVRSGPLAGLGLGLGVRHVGESYNAANTVAVPDYTLVDAAVRFDLARLRPELAGASLALNVTNLTDETYYTPGFYDNTVFYGNRRQVLGTLTYRW